MRYASLVLVSLLLLSCAGAPAAASLDGTRWRVAGGTATLQFEGDHATGSGGCNQYRAPYTADGARLTFGPVISTKRACLDEGANRQETAYFNALEKVASFTMTGERLVLRDAGGATLLELSRM